MSADRVQINVRERPYSTDINALQAMQTRMMADLLQFLGAEVLAPLEDGSNAKTRPRNWTSGLSVVPAGGGTTVRVNPGMLGQYSVFHPNIATALETNMRLGFLRAPIEVAHPGGANNLILVEARVTDVTTVTDNRDVMNAVGGNFVPTLLDKQIERHIEIQFVAGGGLFPVFSGDGWVPLRIIETDAGGLWNGPNLIPDVDLRPDLRWSLGSGTPTHPDALATEPGSGDITDYTLGVPVVSPASDGLNLHTNIHGSIDGQRVWAKGSVPDLGGLLASPVDGYARTANTYEHLYLVPFISGGQRVWPIVTGLQAATTRGFLVATGIPPSRGGPHASADITLGSIASNMDTVPARKALHVASIPLKSATSYHYFMQDRTGRATTRNGTAALSALLEKSVSLGPTDVSAEFPTITWTPGTDLPPNVRTLFCNIQVLSGPFTSPTFIRIGPLGLAPGEVASADNQLVNSIECPVNDTRRLYGMEIPVGFRSDDPTFDLGLRAYAIINSAANPQTITLRVRVVGWRY